MQARYILVAACAALAVGASRADDAAKAQGEPGKTSESSVHQDAGSAKDQGTKKDDPGMLPDHVEDDASTRADAAKQPTEAERQAGGAIGTQTGGMRSVIGTVAAVEQDKITVRPGTAGDKHELTLDAKTRITKQGEEITRDQLSAGDEVRASYAQDSMTATEIQVIGAGTGSQPGTEATPQGSGTTTPAPTTTTPAPTTSEPATGAPSGSGDTSGRR